MHVPLSIRILTSACAPFHKELYACGVGNAGAAALLEGIADNPASAIVDMDLRGNPVTSAAAQSFGEFARLRSRPIALHPFSDDAAARSD